MDDRLAAVAAIVVGTAVAAVGTLEYVLPGYAPPPLEPFVSGLLVVGAGLFLLVAGLAAARTAADSLALRAATAVGVGTLFLAVIQPEALLFGGVFWLALVAFGLVAAGAYRTGKTVRKGVEDSG